MTDYILRRSAILFGRVAQAVLAALAAMLTLYGLAGGPNVIVAGAAGIMALALLAFAGVVEFGIRLVRPEGVGQGE